MAKQWFVVQTYSQFEDRVRKQLLELIERKAMQDSFGEVVIPVEKVVDIKDGKRVEKLRKIYPGYVFIEMEMNEETWHLVNSVPRLSFPGGGNDRPTPILHSEMEIILKRMQEGVENPRPKTLFSVGEELRITAGPFTDFNGTVEEVNYDKNRVKVSVFILGQPTPVELEFTDVEKIE